MSAELLLFAILREELGKNINADEAAAMGAVYQAAALSKAFKVKPFLVREAAIFPIQVSCGWVPRPGGARFRMRDDSGGGTGSSSLVEVGLA